MPLGLVALPLLAEWGLLRRMNTPTITIIVRHAADCKYSGDEFYKGCKCRKALRWFANGKQQRKSAGTRSWSQAETERRRLEDQLAGRVTEQPTGQDLRGAVTVFLNDRKARGVTADSVAKYKLVLERFQMHAATQDAYTLPAAVKASVLVSFQAKLIDWYPSSFSRSVVQKRLSAFFRFATAHDMLAKRPSLTPVKVTTPETEPLTDEEYGRLLGAIDEEFKIKQRAPVYRAIIQLMRWSGLAVRDAVTLKLTDIQHDKAKGVWLIVRKRVKTGSNLFVPIPAAVATELLTVSAGHAEYVFWANVKNEAGLARQCSNNISDAFTRAGIARPGWMVSHRLRSTFAVDLLQKGVALEHVSKLLGHKNVRTTELHYSRWIKSRQDLLTNIVSASWQSAQ